MRYKSANTWLLWLPIGMPTCAVDDEVGEREAPFVVEQLPDVLLEDVVPDAGEVVVDVRFQYPSVCAAVPAVILPHEVA